MKIYLAGKITGDPEYKAKFEAAEKQLRKENPASIILNPAILPEGLEEEDYMRITMDMLLAADEAVFLEDATESLGAIAEGSMCRKLGKPCRTLALEKSENSQ